MRVPPDGKRNKKRKIIIIIIINKPQYTLRNINPYDINKMYVAHTSWELKLKDLS